MCAADSPGACDDVSTLYRESVTAARAPGRAERLRAVLERDGPACVWCGRLLGGLVEATTDHLVPRVKGGPSWLENEVAACRRCNRERGHRGIVEWLDECDRRGWPAAADTVVSVLRSLADAIGERGGQRRARPYVASQLRRLGRRQTSPPGPSAHG